MTIPLLFIPSDRTEELSCFIYRTAWENWLLCRGDKAYLEKLMDSFQHYCTDTGRPGKEWDDFKKTLPGYESYWKRFLEESRIETY